MTTEECDIIRRRNWCNTHECVVKPVNVSSTKWQYNEKKMKYMYVNPIPYGLFNKPEVMGGGQICTP